MNLFNCGLIFERMSDLLCVKAIQISVIALETWLCLEDGFCFIVGYMPRVHRGTRLFWVFKCPLAVQRTLSLWLCPSTTVETAIAQCTSRWAMARGHRLNTSIVMVAVHGLSGLFRAVSAVELSLFRPLPPLSPSLISHLASVDVKQNGPAEGGTCEPVWPGGKAL